MINDQLTQLAAEKKAVLLAKVADSYGPEAAITMEGFVAFSSRLAPVLLDIDPTNPQPEKVELAVRAIAVGFNQVLNAHFQPLPGKQRVEVGIK